MRSKAPFWAHARPCGEGLRGKLAARKLAVGASRGRRTRFMVYFGSEAALEDVRRKRGLQERDQNDDAEFDD